MATTKKTSSKKTTSKRKISKTKKSTAGKAKSPARGKRRMTAKPSEELRIAVTFKRPSDGLGLVRYGAGMTSEVVGTFEPDQQTIGKAVSALEKEGFRVSSRGRMAIVVRGHKKDFERVFGTKISPFAMRADKMNRPSSDSVFFPKKGAPWNPDPDIIELIDDAYIQWPHIYMNQRFTPPPSPLPPRISYHHLRVPGDVALLTNAARAHREGVTGVGVRVAMVDSGFAHGHPYFQEMGYNSAVTLAAGANKVDLDGVGHGTGESANLFAIAPDITFIGVKVDNEDNPYLGASMLEGFQEALRHSPDVISVSMGYDLCPTNINGNRISNNHLTVLPNSLIALEAEIQAAVADGVVVVFSSGNGHVGFPGMMPDVISAGGVFVEEDGTMKASDYASAFDSKIYAGRNVPDFCGLVGMAVNHAEYIMLPIQPGCSIDTDESATDETGPNDGWGVFSGTSAAAPQVAGACALMLQVDSSLTLGDIKQILRRNCRDVTLGSANPASNENNGGMPAGFGDDGATGAGLMDIYAALSQL